MPDDNTELTDVWFQDLRLQPQPRRRRQTSSRSTDAEGIYTAYTAMCEAQGLDRPNVLT